MRIFNFEWEILEGLEKIKCTFLNYLNYFLTTLLGGVAIIAIIFIIYWIINKEKGQKLAFTLIISMTINNFLKGLFNKLRPFEYKGKEHLRTLKDMSLNDHATGSSFPSGHSQNASTFFSSIIINYHAKRYLILKILSVLAIIIVGFTRIYLGVHFPGDVIIGILIGIIVAIIFTHLQNLLGDKKYWIYLFVTICVLPCLLFKSFERDFFKAYGLLLGFTIASILEYKFIKFDCNVTKKQKMIRILIGLLVVGITYGIYAFVPDVIHNNKWFTLTMHSLISFNAIFTVPLIFKKIEKKK